MNLDIDLSHPREYNLSKIEAKLVTMGMPIEEAEKIAEQILDDAYETMVSYDMSNKTGRWN